jgi:hypothetical protein
MSRERKPIAHLTTAVPEQMRPVRENNRRSDRRYGTMSDGFL